jgi:predicted O-methyltransferase YrrM
MDLADTFELPQPPTGLRRLTAPLRFARRLSALPPRVAWFHLRARARAWRLRDDAPKGALRADDLAVLMRVASGRRRVVELGTAKAWTAISLAVADEARTVVTYDPVVQHVRARYAELVPERVRARITFVDQPGSVGPLDPDSGVDLLFIDSSHEREETVREYERWRPALAPGSVVVFDDYNHPDFPGVRQAVDSLGLTGEVRGLLYIASPSS